MTSATTEMLNGVDTARLADTFQAVKANPTLGRFEFRCRNKWSSGAQNQSTVKDFYGAGAEDTTRQAPFLLDADEPSMLLGKDTAVNPVEFVLHALASCLTTSMVYHAAARGIEIQAVQCTLEGDLDIRGFLGMDPNIRKGYQGIRVSFEVQTDASAEKLAELAQYSPVRDTISNPVPVSVEVRTKPAERSAAQ